METKFTIPSEVKTQARSEAVIYAVGTPFTADELFAEWVTICEADGELVSSQIVYEEVLREHPQFENDWLE